MCVYTYIHTVLMHVHVLYDTHEFKSYFICIQASLGKKLIEFIEHLTGMDIDGDGMSGGVMNKKQKLNTYMYWHGRNGRRGNETKNKFKYIHIWARTRIETERQEA
jgi:hypothetical protein